MEQDVNFIADDLAATTESSTVENTQAEDGFDFLDFGDEAEASAEVKSSNTEAEAKETPNEEHTDEEKEQPESEDKENENAPENEKPEAEEATGAEKRKLQLNTEIRDKVAERNALRAEIEELTRRKFALNSEIPQAENLMDQVNPETGEYYTRYEAQQAQMRAELDKLYKEREAREYSDKIMESTMQLREESERVLKDFPMFDQDSPEYNATIAQAADKILSDSLIKEPGTDQVIGSSVSPYALYATIAQAYGLARQTGEVEARKSYSKMAAQADIPSTPTASPQKEEYDPFMDGFDS